MSSEAPEPEQVNNTSLGICIPSTEGGQQKTLPSAATLPMPAKYLFELPQSVLTPVPALGQLLRTALQLAGSR